jgi:uncharacterized membrane protein
VTLIPSWHPLIVHFPIALVLCAAGAFFAARLVRQERLAATLATLGTWNLCLGAAGVVCAFASGLAATIDLQLGEEARHALSLHVTWAATASFFVLLLAVWRAAGSRQEARPSGLFLAVLIVASAALIATAYRGGLNVYHFGIGVVR